MGLNPQGYIYGEEPTNTNPFWDEESGAIASLTATASVDNTTGTPVVEVTKSGTDAAPNFNFAFTGLKGPKGDKGDPGSGGGIEIPKIRVRSAYNQSSIFPTEEGYKSATINFTDVTVDSGTLEDAISSGNYELRLLPTADTINGYMSLGEKLLFINELAVVTPKFTAFNYTTQKSYTATDVTCYCYVRPSDNQVTGYISMKWEESTEVDYSQYLQYTPKGTFFTFKCYSNNPLFTLSDIIALINADVSGDNTGAITFNLSDTSESYSVGVDTRANLLGGGQQYDSLSIMRDYILGKQSFYTEINIKLLQDNNAMIGPNPEDIDNNYNSRILKFSFPDGIKVGLGDAELVPLGVYGAYGTPRIILDNEYTSFYIKDSTTGKIYYINRSYVSFETNDITFTMYYEEYTPNT